MYYGRITSKWGRLTAKISGEGALCGLWFENQKYFPSIDADAIWLNRVDSPSEIPRQVTRTFNQLMNQLSQYENGERQTFDIPLAPSGTPFRKVVWDALLQVPYGQTSTYGQIAALVAKRLGKKTMSGQATGGAVGHNPISIIIPCHRIIGKNGALTGYAGGLDKKEALLLHERRHKEKGRHQAT